MCFATIDDRARARKIGPHTPHPATLAVLLPPCGSDRSGGGPTYLAAAPTTAFMIWNSTKGTASTARSDPRARATMNGRRPWRTRAGAGVSLLAAGAERSEGASPVDQAATGSCWVAASAPRYARSGRSRRRAGPFAPLSSLRCGQRTRRVPSWKARTTGVRAADTPARRPEQSADQTAGVPPVTEAAQEKQLRLARFHRWTLDSHPRKPEMGTASSRRPPQPKKREAALWFLNLGRTPTTFRSTFLWTKARTRTWSGTAKATNGPAKPYESLSLIHI